MSTKHSSWAALLPHPVRLVGGLALGRLSRPIKTRLAAHRLEDEHQAPDSHHQVRGQLQQDCEPGGAPDDLSVGRQEVRGGEGLLAVQREDED